MNLAANMTTAHQVVVVTYDGLCTFEFGIAVEIFGLPRPEFNFPWYKFDVCSCSGTTIRATGGIQMSVAHDLSFLENADTIIIPGWSVPYDVKELNLIHAIVKASARGARVVSICGGVFVLAAAGILDYKPATTHWHLVERLAFKYPKIDVRTNALYTIAGNVMTSAGSSAGIDLCLRIVSMDFGENVARQVAQRMVAHPMRDGMETQVTIPCDVTRTDSKLTRFIGLLSAKFNSEISVAEMARLANMSERTLHRKFRTEVGMSPSGWLIKQRVRVATQFLLHTDMSIEKISSESGFSSVDTFRNQFKVHTGMSPSKYRQASYLIKQRI